MGENKWRQKTQGDDGQKKRKQERKSEMGIETKQTEIMRDEIDIV